MVIDTSILLAIYFDEPQAAWAAQKMNSSVTTLCMSTVSLTETLIHLHDRQPKTATLLEEKLLHSGILFVPPSLSVARLAAEARLRFPLNLGDCFVYGLAVEKNQPILTLDRDFKSLDCPVILPDRKYKT